METTGTLANQLLIAMPGMADPNFSSTVTLICEHNDEGALGIVINRPLNLKLGGLFEQLQLENPDPAALDHPVLMGGPVGPERGFVLHDTSHQYENSLAVSGEICLTLSRDVIDAMAASMRSMGLYIVLVFFAAQFVAFFAYSGLGQILAVLGADALATVHAVELIPARIALAKLRITFHDRSTVQFDLPSDHRAEEFAADVAHRIRPILTRAVAA